MRKIFFIYTYYQKNDPVANSSLFELFFLEASHFSEDSYAEKSRPITSNNEANILRSCELWFLKQSNIKLVK